VPTNQHTPIQQYISVAGSDICRQHLHTPAPYLRNTFQVATLPLLWARSQNKNIPDPQQHNHTTPYVGPPCLRCNPGAASTQGQLILPTHLPTDTYHHIVNDCVSLQEERTTLEKSLEAVMIDLGLENDEWDKIPTEDKTTLAMASDPPKAWTMRMKTIIKWREAALPHCAQFALKVRQTLPKDKENHRCNQIHTDRIRTKQGQMDTQPAQTFVVRNKHGHEICDKATRKKDSWQSARTR